MFMLIALIMSTNYWYEFLQLFTLLRIYVTVAFVHYIDESLFLYMVLQGACVKKLEGFGKVKDSKATKQIVALLSAPLEKYNNVVTVLTLTNYPKVMEHLDYGTNKVMSGVIIQSIMKNGTLITEADKVTDINNLSKISMINQYANRHISAG